MFDEPSIVEIFSHEYELLEKGYDTVIGIDEAGRGPLAGPVVACAVAWRNWEPPGGSSLSHPVAPEIGLIRDSKKLSEKQRESLYDFILENFHVGVGICDHRTIDRINVLEATYLAMKKAINSLTREISNNKFQISNLACRQAGKFQNSNFQFQNLKNIILVDGNKTIPNLSMEQRAIIGGDKIVKSISAASIVAKVTRDRMMREMDAKYPKYGFLKHKGYGTSYHREMIKKHGSCEIHRKSFLLF